jgi:hypothetical protein
VAAGQSQHLAVAFDADDLGLGGEHAQDVADTPAAEAENEDPSAARRREEEKGRGERPPHDPGHRMARPVQRGQRAVHAQLETVPAPPHLDVSSGRQSSLQAAAPGISP